MPGSHIYIGFTYQ